MDLTEKIVNVRLDERGRPVVLPGRVAVKRTQAVKIMNQTAYPITVFVPSAAINQTAGPGDSVRVTLDKDVGHYRYAVYCDEVDDFAEGASSPEIIIKP